MGGKGRGNCDGFQLKAKVKYVLKGKEEIKTFEGKLACSVGEGKSVTVHEKVEFQHR